MSIDYIMVFGIALLFFSTITYTAFDRQDAARDQAAFHEYKSIADRFVFHIEEVIRYAGMNRDEDYEKRFSPHSTEKSFRFGVEISQTRVLVYSAEAAIFESAPLNNPMGFPVSGSAGGFAMTVSVLYSASTGNITVSSI